MDWIFDPSCTNLRGGMIESEILEISSENSFETIKLRIIHLEIQCSKAQVLRWHLEMQTWGCPPHLQWGFAYQDCQIDSNVLLGHRRLLKKGLPWQVVYPNLSYTFWGNKRSSLFLPRSEGADWKQKSVFVKKLINVLTGEEKTSEVAPLGPDDGSYLLPPEKRKRLKSQNH